MTDAPSLTDFLLARIAEDEAAAPFVFAEQFTPARVIAECEAKRWIVAHAAFVGDHAGATDWTQGSHASAQLALRTLGAIYADHPDYRAEWRP